MLRWGRSPVIVQGLGNLHLPLSFPPELTLQPSATKNVLSGLARWQIKD